jgi:hypothetical protein
MTSPALARLVRTTAAALPLTDDPWASLAHGLRLSRTELADLLRQLQSDGLLLGIWGEPHAHRAGAQLANLAAGPPPPDAIVRWLADEGPAALLAPALLPGARPIAEYHKVGLVPDPTESHRGLLEPSADRTSLAPQEPVAPAAPSPHAAAVDAALRRPAPFDPEAPLWEALATTAGVPPAAARAAARELVLARHWQRLALRWDIAALGWAGCGLAVWSLAGPDDAREAGRLLAGLHGTAEVFTVNGPGPGATLHALLLAPAAGPAETAARALAQHWGVPLVDWAPLRLH